MAITAKMVKELRDKTGAGMMDCKKALAETNGDIESAVDWLRKKGVASASKKAGRIAAEGKVVALAEGSRGVLVEVNTETDFTAKNENFVTFAQTVAKIALDNSPEDVDALGALDYPDTGRDVAGELKEKIATIGENMNLRRYGALDVSEGAVASYIHMGGKIGVLVALESSADADALLGVGKKIAMHVAASAPAFLDRSSVSEDALERERAVLSEQAKDSGKPDHIIEKMVTGRLNKYYGEVCLLEQPFVMDPDTKVGKYLDQAGKDLGTAVKVTGYLRFALGEGIEKRQEDFAEEVQKQMQG
ncbi:translation elongation factor Ts [Magnetococcales bacterium HHB-1]